MMITHTSKVLALLNGYLVGIRRPTKISIIDGLHIQSSLSSYAYTKNDIGANMVEGETHRRSTFPGGATA